MNLFYDYISGPLRKRSKEKSIVVWYDPNGDFSPYVDSLEEAGKGEGGKVRLDDLSADLARFEGSFFMVRVMVEPQVEKDQPDPLLIYIPGVKRDRTGSVLMELEKAGCAYEPNFKKIARGALPKKFTDGVIDEMLKPESLSCRDVIEFLKQSPGPGETSMLKAIYRKAGGDKILPKWLVNDDKDAAIKSKNAGPELFKLIRVRLGLELDQGASLSDARSKAIRYILVNEFRSDLLCDHPDAPGLAPEAPSKEYIKNIR
ncbi:MAG: PglZ domain-containing protein, partial [Desulfobacterales bacterium]|nr:PglZ domain-containing protein [Desulfobacterales bacterium]